MSMMGLEIHEACTVGDRESLEDHLQSGKFDVNMKDPDWGFRTPLHWACAKGYVDCIRILLEYGAKGTSRMSMGWTPAHAAAEAGKLNALRALNSAGISVIKKDKYGDRPSDVANMYGHEECHRFLREIENDKNKTDKSEQSTESDSEECLSDDDNVH